MADEGIQAEPVGEQLLEAPANRDNAAELVVLQARLVELQRLKAERQVKALEIEQEELEHKEACPEEGQDDQENWVRTSFPRCLFKFDSIISNLVCTRIITKSTDGCTNIVTITLISSSPMVAPVSARTALRVSP
jgi:hypothetical protein